MSFVVKKDALDKVWVLYDGTIVFDTYDTEEEAEKMKSFLEKAVEIQSELESRLASLLEGETEEFLNWLKNNYFGNKIELEL